MPEIEQATERGQPAPNLGMYQYVLSGVQEQIKFADSKAGFVAALNTESLARVFHKGTDPGIDSYSGFFDNGHRKATGLGDFLRQKEVTAVTIVGLATDYCIQFTALDARQLGFETTVVLEGVRGVDLREGDCERAIDEMRRAGVNIARARVEES